MLRTSLFLLLCLSFSSKALSLSSSCTALAQSSQNLSEEQATKSEPEELVCIFDDMNLNSDILRLTDIMIRQRLSLQRDKINFEETMERFLGSDEAEHKEKMRKNFPDFDYHAEDKMKLALQHYRENVQAFKNTASLINKANILFDIRMASLQREQYLTTQFHDLSLSQFMAIYKYTANAHRKLNEYLREGSTPNEDFDYYTRVLKSALAKLPHYTGPLKRYVTKYSDFLTSHCKDCVVNYNYFVSTAELNGAYGELDMNPQKYKLLIHSDSGSSIRYLSSIPEEEEVLLPPGLKFKVSSIQGKTLQLEEVP